MKIHYYDKLSRKNLNKKIIQDRLKLGLESTICVYMTYNDYKITRRDDENQGFRLGYEQCMKNMSKK